MIGSRQPIQAAFCTRPNGYFFNTIADEAAVTQLWVKVCFWIAGSK